MHGSIFVFLKRYIESTYDYSTWVKLMESTGIDRISYQMQEMYPTRELTQIIGAVSSLSGNQAHEVQEQFGAFLVPDLLMIYKKYVLPEWTTYDLLLHAESNMHGAVRSQDTRTTPPILSVNKVSSRLLVIDYHSRRRMASVGIGIVKGIAAYFNESDKVTVSSITSPDAERVQLRVEFGE
ncbi:hypothetical protein GCM10023188_03500 [Pontibacter saemangeumensis]|uniref:Heme NO-binding domain-containing protein n=2 Tax=Pontibacter saemangeumensis TaxID=1084525 RepID=A0ABP8L883_9BACT